VPFVVMVVRVGTTGRRVFLNGDLALLDVQAHRAAAWRLALGPYDRYGWHHPGPAYLYMIATAERVLGGAHGARAEVCTAVIVNGLSLAAAVFVVGRCLGRRAGIGAALVALALVVGLGAPFLTSAWNPYVVLLPLFLCGVLAAMAMLGSATAWAASVLVGTFAVETDIGTAPFVLVVVGAATVAVAWRRHTGRRVEGRRWAWVALVAVAAGLWIPALYQQIAGPRGNVAAIARFLLHGGGRAGPVTGAAAAGYGLAVPLRLLRAGPVTNSSLLAWLRTQIVVHRWPGLLSAAAVTVAAGALAWFTRRRRDGAGALTWVGVLGLVAAVVAGTSIIGIAFRWLLVWAGAVTALLVLAAVLVACASSLLRRARVRAVLLGVVVAGAVALSAAAAVVGDGLTSDPAVARGWAAIAPVVARQPHPVVALVLDDTGAALAGGMEAQLAAAGVPFEVTARWENQYTSDSTAPATLRVSLTALAPAGFTAVTSARGVSVAYAEGGGPMSSST
jgi:hypothetical protein